MYTILFCRTIFQLQEHISKHYPIWLFISLKNNHENFHLYDFFW